MSDEPVTDEQGADGATEAGAEASTPLLRVVNPDATPEEIAAVVAVFSAIGSAAQPPPPQPPSEWAARHRGMRRSYPNGPNGWRNSALPR